MMRQMRARAKSDARLFDGARPECG